VLLGGICTIAVSILLIIETTAIYGKWLRWTFYIVPIFALDFGLVNISNREILKIVFKEDKVPAPLSMDVALPSAIFLVAAVPFFWLLVIIIEKKVFQKMCRCRRNNTVENETQARVSVARRSSTRAQPPGMGEEAIDEDVIKEEEQVRDSEPGIPVMIYKLRKVFSAVGQKSVVAVHNVSFGLEFGECFALLGVSGAGKTTTFKCLTGEETPSTGKVQIRGFDVTTISGFDKARKLIGYCP